MHHEEMEKLIRVYILDTLIYNSGKNLTPEIIGIITNELLDRLMEILKRKD